MSYVSDVCDQYDNCKVTQNVGSVCSYHRADKTCDRERAYIQDGIDNIDKNLVEAFDDSSSRFSFFSHRQDPESYEKGNHDYLKHVGVKKRCYYVRRKKVNDSGDKILICRSFIGEIRSIDRSKNLHTLCQGGK